MGSFERDLSYDVFIAYYGNRVQGSEAAAHAVYEYINNAKIGPGKYIRAYFHPAVNPYGNFEETPLIVSRTPLLLLVADKNIPTNSYGQLLKHREDGSLRNLFEEVRAFHDSAMYKNRDCDMVSKVFISDHMDPKAAEKLHTIFSGTTSFTRCEEVLEWIKYFYTHTYNERLRANYERLAQTNLDEFLRGNWIPEAEAAWRAMRHESVGRCLLIYHGMKVMQGNNYSAREIERLKEEFAAFNRLEPKTLDLLKKV